MNLPRQRFLLLLAAWAVAVATAGAFEVLRHLPSFVVPLLVAAPAIVLSIGSRRWAWLASVVSGLSLRSLLALHLVRFVGIYFLWLHAWGRLPADFAYRAGWGDIAAAAGAWGLLLLRDEALLRRLLPWWNAFSLLDLVVAVGTGAWLNVAHPGSMIEIARFPLVLVPLFFVPLLIASHVVLFHRLRELPRGASAAAGAARLSLEPATAPDRGLSGPPSLKQRVAFALIMGVVTTGVLSFTLLSLNLGYNDRFLRTWLRSWAIGYVLVIPAILILGPIIQRGVERLLTKPVARPAVAADAPTG